MQQQFPLSERLWLEWLDDELKAASKPKAHAAITALFELAVQDYLSVPVWVKYLECVPLHASTCQAHQGYELRLAARVLPQNSSVYADGGPCRRFLREHDSAVQGMTVGGLELFRSIAERALSAGGLHVALGSQLWDLYRSFRFQSLPPFVSFKSHR